MEQVLLVDANDQPIGAMEKLEAHNKGALHRAISVLVSNDRGEYLLQQRALGKYHCPGLWANTCCSHPRPGEETHAAALRRLREEMGFTCALHEAFVFTYRSEFPNGLIEHEIDHVFFGKYEGVVSPNPDEVASYRWMSIEQIKREIHAHPEQFASWFVLIVERL